MRPGNGEPRADGFVEVTVPDHGAATRGNLCNKGRFGFQRVQNRD
ncbi:hypothetical protein ABZ479_38875 [Streptomyces sp. NPDC005722]